jgi:hypothetical protein
VRCRSSPATQTVRSSNSRSDMALMEIVVMFLHNTTVSGRSERYDVADREPKRPLCHSVCDRSWCMTTRRCGDVLATELSRLPPLRVGAMME